MPIQDAGALHMAATILSGYDALGILGAIQIVVGHIGGPDASHAGTHRYSATLSTLRI